MANDAAAETADDDRQRLGVMMPMAKAAHQAYRVIQQAIASGEISPGSWLREEDVAARVGVSRTPVREALRQLHAQGLVEIVPNRGALVLGWTSRDLDDIHDLRTLLEGYGARRAAEVPDNAAVVQRLTELCTEMERLLQEHGEAANPGIGELSLEFHLAIIQASGNRHLAVIMPSLIQIPLAREGYNQRAATAVERSMLQHREIVQALTARDGDWAEGVMRAHVRSGRATLRGITRLPETVANVSRLSSSPGDADEPPDSAISSPRTAS